MRAAAPSVAAEPDDQDPSGVSQLSKSAPTPLDCRVLQFDVAASPGGQLGPRPAPASRGGGRAEDTATVEPDERLVTVLVTLAVPDTADADDAATLIAVTADSTALTVVHATGVEGHMPLPGGTVLRGRQKRPWMVQSVVPHAAILTDLTGGTIHVALTSLHPDQVDSPPEPTASAPHHPQPPHGPRLSGGVPAAATSTRSPRRRCTTDR